jgi:hypothetical protein
MLTRRCHGITFDPLLYISDFAHVLSFSFFFFNETLYLFLFPTNEKF